MTKNIVVASRPRCGNTWLNRLLGDALNSPLLAVYRDGIDEPEYFGEGEDGDYLIRKTHDARPFPEWPVVLIYRDPRDIAVSRMSFNKFKGTLEQNIRGLGTCYEAYVKWWAERADCVTSYEQLHDKQAVELNHIVKALLDIELDWDWCQKVFERQSFDNIKAQYAPRFDGSMRKGIVGDWKNYFKQSDGEFITMMLGELMMSQGYIDSLDWWKELPE